MTMALVELAGTGALVSTLALYLTEVPLLQSLLTTQSTRGVQYSAIIMNLVNNIFGFYYAVLSSTDVSMITNGVGTVLHAVLCFVYLGVASKRVGALFVTIGAAAFVAAGAAYLETLDAGAERLDSLGLLSATICSLAFVTPVLSVVEAWQTGNADAISIPVTWGSLFCSSIWWIYGILLDNIFIQLPNIPGVFVSVAALLVVWQLGEKQKNVGDKKSQ